MSMFHRMQYLTDEYQLTYPGDGLCVNLDDALAERAFLAAVEFLATDGVYCMTTGRVIQFDEGEILQAAREAPREIIVGEGRDQRTITQKRMGGREPLNQCPGHHAPFSEELAPLAVKNFAQIPTGDYLEGFNFTKVEGYEIFGMPLEAYAARREVSWLRDGVRKAGRPGMAIAYYPINTRAAVLIAALDPDYGLRRTDGMMLSVLPDVKVEHDMLTAAIICEEYGCFKVNGGGAGIIGSFCGDVEGAVIAAIAQVLAGWIIYRDEICCTGISSTLSSTAKTIESLNPKVLWGDTVVYQALNRNSGLILFGAGTNWSGIGTWESLLELAVPAMNDAVNGANLYIVRQKLARVDAAQTPLEAEWKAKVAEATMRAGITREQSDAIARQIRELVSGRPLPKGVDDVRDCYDWVHHRPSPEYQRIYEDVKEELASYGLSFA